MIYDNRFDMTAQNFGHEENFRQQNNFGYEHKSSNELILVTQDRRDGRLLSHHDGLVFFVTSQPKFKK